MIEGKIVISFQNTQIPNPTLFFLFQSLAVIFLEFWHKKLEFRQTGLQIL